MGRLEPDILQGRRQQWAKPLPNLLLAAPQRDLQQIGEVVAILVGEPGHGQARHGPAQCARHAHHALTRQRPLDRPFSARQQTLHQIQRVDLVLVIQAHLLQVVEQGAFHSPASLVRLVQQGRQ